MTALRADSRPQWEAEEKLKQRVLALEALLFQVIAVYVLPRTGRIPNWILEKWEATRP